MRCCRLLLFLFLFSNLSISLAQNDVVAPLDDNPVISNGEIYQVKIISDRPSSELSEFKNRKINDVMWVMDYFEQDGQRIFEVFVTDPPAPKKNQTEPEKPLFGVTGFKYEYQQKNTQGQIESLVVNFTEKEKFNIKLAIGISLVILVALIVGLIYWRKTARTRKLKRLKNKKAAELIELFDKAKSREDFEEIYDERKYYLDLFSEDSELRKLFNTINQIQYRKEWNIEDLRILTKLKNEIMQLRRRSGI